MTYHIAFEEIHGSLAEHSAPIVEECLHRETFRVTIVGPRQELELVRAYHAQRGHGLPIEYRPFEEDISDWGFDAILTTVQNSPGMLFTDSRSPVDIPRIALRHGLTDKKDQFPAHFTGHPIGYYNCLFATGSVMFKGSWETYLEKHPYTEYALAIFDIGAPKTDDLFSDRYDRTAILQALELDPEKPTILYAPTYQKEASLQQQGEAILEALAGMKDCNVLVRLHYYSMELNNPEAHKLGHQGKDWQAIMDRLAAEHPNVRHVKGNSNPWFRAADLMVGDVSGACFEYALLDKPIIFIDCPKYFEAQGREGIGFWGRSIGDIISDISTLAKVIRTNLTDPDQYKEQRRALISKLVYNPGQATKVAVDTLTGLVAGDIPYPTWGPDLNQQEDNMRHEYIVQRLGVLCGKNIAFYGAGVHALFLLDLMDQAKKRGIPQPTVACILDDDPDGTGFIDDIPVVLTETLDVQDIRHVVLATDYFQPQMKARCMKLFGDAVEAIDLYEPFPWYRPGWPPSSPTENSL